MSVRVFIRDHPHRTIALATDEHVLVFRHSLSSTESASSSSLRLSNQLATPRCLVEFTARSSLDLTEYRSIGNGQGTLGLITLNSDVFLCVISSSSQVATVRPGETVQRIHAVEFCRSSIPSSRSWSDAHACRLPQPERLRPWTGPQRTQSVPGPELRL